MRWIDSVVTDTGNQMIGEVIAGRRLTITRAVGGAEIVDPALLNTLTELTEPMQELILLGVEDRTSGKLIKIQVRNTNLDTEYILRQIGVYAQLEGDDTDALFFVMQDYNGAQIPATEDTPDFLFEIYAALGISNAANITLKSDPNAVLSPGALSDALNGFLKIGDTKPTAGPALWFDTSSMKTDSEVLLQLSEDSSESGVTADIGGTEYVVTNASV